jgi:serine/threonine-protein phosphatase CPPED1
MTRLLAFAAFLISGLLAQRVQEPFFFVQASDPQFGMYSQNRDFARETANFESLITTVNRLKPAFLIVTGDLVNRRGDAAQIREYRRIAARLNRAIPFYNVAGNHDVGDVPNPDSLAFYRRVFGRDYYSFRVGTLAAIVLNSSLISHPEHALEEAARQDAWFREEAAKLKRGGSRHLVLFQHHPWYLLSADEPDEYFNIPRERRKPWLELLRKFGFEAVFAGHYHQSLASRSEGIEFVTTGPVGKPAMLGSSGFRVVIVRPEGLEHEYYSLDEPPARIDLKGARSRASAF